MKNYQELLDMKMTTDRNYRSHEQAVNEAVKCLIENGFTDIDIATLMTAEETEVCTAILDKYAELHRPKTERVRNRTRQVQKLKKDSDMNVNKILVREDGYVRAKVTVQTRQSKNYMSIQYLEDGLSYLNYAKLGSDRGLGKPDVGAGHIWTPRRS